MLTLVMKMERIVWQGLLYDFYGELLTERQRHIYEDVVFNDLSLSEIAREEGVTRQGVHDLVRRCDRILEGYEEKLRLVETFQKTKELRGASRSFWMSMSGDRKRSVLGWRGSWQGRSWRYRGGFKGVLLYRGELNCYLVE